MSLCLLFRKQQKQKEKTAAGFVFFFCFPSHSNVIADCEEKVYYLSSHSPSKGYEVIRKQLRVKRLLKPYCLGCGLEGLNFVTDHGLGDIGEAAELQAQLEACRRS